MNDLSLPPGLLSDPNRLVLDSYEFSGEVGETVSLAEAELDGEIFSFSFSPDLNALVCEHPGGLAVISGRQLIEEWIAALTRLPEAGEEEVPGGGP